MPIGNNAANRIVGQDPSYKGSDARHHQGNAEFNDSCRPVEGSESDKLNNEADDAGDRGNSS